MSPNTLSRLHAVHAAIYARYSTDKQNASSVEDQVRVCTEFASSQGWEIIGTYADEAISGAATGNRPQYQAAMRDAFQKKFHVLLVMDLTRLSRSIADLNKAIDQLAFRDIKVVGVSDGYDSERKGHKAVAGITGVMGELFREAVREKTYEGLKGRAQRGSHTGGRTFGYNTGVVDPISNFVDRKICEQEASVVRRIFADYASGKSPRSIAAALNAEGIASPRGGTWASSAIYGDIKDANGVLNNELYVGCQIWSRLRWVKDPDTGKRTYVRRPESEWVRTENPSWRIVDDELWSAVQARRAVATESSTGIKKALHRNARTGAGPKFLFSGLLKCGCCGARYVIAGPYSYRCSHNINRGASVCANKLGVPRKLVEARLLSAIKDELFSTAAIDLFIRESSRLLAEHAAKRKPELETAQRRLSKLEGEIANLVKAVMEGFASPALQLKLQQAESERESLEALVSDGTQVAQEIAAALPNAVERYRELVGNLETTLQRDIDCARHQLKILLGEILLHPADGHLEAELSGNFEGLITLARRESSKAKVKLSLVAGTGFEPVTFGL